MSVDWQLIGVGGANLVSIVAAYYGLKADNTKNASDLKIAILTEKGDRNDAIADAKRDMTTVLNTIDDCVKDLSHRVMSLENGQNEWTKALRERTHELADKLQTLSIEVDRLKRPMAPRPERS